MNRNQLPILQGAHALEAHREAFHEACQRIAKDSTQLHVSKEKQECLGTNRSADMPPKLSDLAQARQKDAGIAGIVWTVVAAVVAGALVVLGIAWVLA